MYITSLCDYFSRYRMTSSKVVAVFLSFNRYKRTVPSITIGILARQGVLPWRQAALFDVLVGVCIWSAT